MLISNLMCPGVITLNDINSKRSYEEIQKLHYGYYAESIVIRTPTKTDLLGT